MDTSNAVPVGSTPLMYLLEMDFVFSRSMGGGVLDRYYVRALSLHKRNPPVVAGGRYASIRMRLLFKNHLYFFFEFRQVVYHYAPEDIG